MLRLNLFLLSLLVSSSTFTQNKVATKCNLIIDFQYDQIKEFSQNRAAVSQDDNWGFIDNRGEIVVPCKYTEVKSFANNIGAVKANNKWYLINLFGVIISTEGYEDVDYSKNLVKAKKDGKWGALDFHMQQVVPFVHNELIFRNDEFILIENKMERYGIINFKGDTIIPPKYRSIAGTENVFLCITNEYMGAFYSEKGEQLTPFIWDAYGNEHFTNGKIILSKGKEEKVILDQKFNVIAQGFEYLAHGHDDLFTATLNKKTGIYNVATKSWIVEPIYDWLDYFGYEKWFFGLYDEEMHYGVINENDGIVVEPTSTLIPTAVNQIIILSNNEKKAFHCLESKYQSSFEFEDVLATEDGRIILVKKNGGWSVINTNGEQIATDLIAIYQPIISENLIGVQNKHGKWGYYKYY